MFGFTMCRGRSHKYIYYVYYILKVSNMIVSSSRMSTARFSLKCRVLLAKRPSDKIIFKSEFLVQFLWSAGLSKSSWKASFIIRICFSSV